MREEEKQREIAILASHVLLCVDVLWKLRARHKMNHWRLRLRLAASQEEEEGSSSAATPLLNNVRAT